MQYNIAATKPLKPVDSRTDYYTQSRPEILPLIPKTASTLLDIGCAEGLFGESVKRLLPKCEIWGIEPVPEVAQRAAQRMDRVICKALEEISDLPEKYFDVVTMNDVLEHFPYSEPVLRLIRRVLKDDGTLVISIPNVRYYLVLLDLVFRNDWRYQDFGVMDRTHFRFFTTESIKRLLEQNGFQADLIKGINFTPTKFKYKILFNLAPRFFESMRHMQIAIVAHPV